MQHKLHCIDTVVGRNLQISYDHLVSPELPKTETFSKHRLVLLSIFVMLTLGCASENHGKEACLPADIWSAEEQSVDRLEGETPLEPLPGSLANNLHWQPIPPEFDPFFADADPDAEICPDAQWSPETEHDGVWFTIETTLCGYLTVAQPLIMDLKKGQKVRIRIWHYRITVAEGPAKLQVAMGCEAENVWATTLDIPTEKGGLIMETWTAPRDFSAGEPVYYNVSNHGSNSWGLIELAILEAEDE